MTWVAVALSGVLAILLPFTMWRHLRKPETLREAWLYTRPGWIVTGCVLALIFLTVGGLFTAAVAQVYPFMWGTFALIIGAAIATVFYLVRFLAFDPSRAVDDLPEPDRDSIQP